MLFATPTYAADDDPLTTSQPVVATFPAALVINLVTGAIIPFVVGWVTNSNWSSRTKAVLHLAISAATGLLTELGVSIASGTTSPATKSGPAPSR